MVSTLEQALSMTVAYQTSSKTYLKDKGKTPEFVVRAGTATAPPRCSLWKAGPDNRYLDVYVLEGPRTLKEWRQSPHLHWCLGGRFYGNGACFLDYRDGELTEYGLVDRNVYEQVNLYPRRPPEFMLRSQLPKQCFYWVDINTGFADKRSVGYDLCVTNETADVTRTAVSNIGGRTLHNVFLMACGHEFRSCIYIGHILNWVHAINRANFTTEIIPHVARISQHVDEWGFVNDGPNDRSKPSTDMTLSRLGDNLVLIRWGRRSRYSTCESKCLVIEPSTGYSWAMCFDNNSLSNFRRTFDTYNTSISGEMYTYHGPTTVRVIGDNVLDGTGLSELIEKLPETAVFKEYGDRRCSVREMRDSHEIPLGALNVFKFSPTGKAMMKFGLDGIVASAIVHGRDYVDESLGIDFMIDDLEDPKAICQNIGISPRQLKSIDEKAKAKNLNIPKVRCLARNIQNISQFDDATFASLCKFDTDMEFWNDINEYNARQFFSLREVQQLPTKRLVEVFSRYCAPNSLIEFVNYATILRDIKLTRHYDAHEFPDFPKNVSEKLSEIRELNARIQVEIDEIKNREKVERFGNAVSKWLYLDYDNPNFPYVMRVARKPGELVIEGTVLHHCVARFDESIILGNEVIVFLRRVASPDKPWYTVDVDKNFNIRQIHGACNSQVKDDPEHENILSFVRSWVLDKHLNIASLSNIERVLCAVY